MAQLTDSFSLWIFSTSRYSSIPFGVIRDTLADFLPRKEHCRCRLCCCRSTASCCISTPQFFLIFPHDLHLVHFHFVSLVFDAFPCPDSFFKRMPYHLYFRNIICQLQKLILTDPVRSEPLPDCPVCLFKELHRLFIRDQSIPVCRHKFINHKHIIIPCTDFPRIVFHSLPYISRTSSCSFSESV